MGSRFRGCTMGGLLVRLGACLGEGKEIESVLNMVQSRQRHKPGSHVQSWLERRVLNDGEASVLEVTICESLAHEGNQNHGNGL